MGGRVGVPDAFHPAEQHHLGEVGQHRPGYGRPLQADFQQAIPEQQLRIGVPLHQGRAHPDRPACDRRSLQGQVQHRALGPCAGRPLRGKRLVHPVQDGPLQGAEIPPPLRFPGRTRQPLHPDARQAGRPGARSILGSRKHPRRGGAAGPVLGWASNSTQPTPPPPPPASRRKSPPAKQGSCRAHQRSAMRRPSFKPSGRSPTARPGPCSPGRARSSTRPAARSPRPHRPRAGRRGPGSG